MDRKLMKLKLEELNLDDESLELFEEYDIETFGDLVQMDPEDVTKKDAIFFVEAILKMDEELDREDKDILKSIKRGDADAFEVLEVLLEGLAEGANEDDEEEEEKPKKKKKVKPVEDEEESPKKKKKPVEEDEVPKKKKRPVD